MAGGTTIKSAMALAFVIGAALGGAARAAGAADPFASNNGFTPPDNSNPPPFEGPYKFRQLSHDYPANPPAHSWADVKPHGPITLDNAYDYMMKLKAYVEPSLRKMIEAPAAWDPASNGWYDMPWMAQAPDSEEGREKILGSFNGQIIIKAAETNGQLKADTQNHTIIYYDAMAASTLREIWKDVGKPNLAAANYREGSLVVKAGGVAATPAEWPVVDGSAVWRVYRPTVQQVVEQKMKDPTGVGTWPWRPAVINLRAIQFDIIVKDSEASPETGWVFTTFIHDKDAPKGAGPWDQLVPLGATWGNDPQFDSYPEGHPPGVGLTEFWRNPKAPSYGEATLGWGGRMSGPIDIAQRHSIVLVGDDVATGSVALDEDCKLLPHQTPSGAFHVSGCLSCHGVSQSGPNYARLYASPVSTRSYYPLDGETVCLYTPGKEKWTAWFQNRSGRTPQNPSISQTLIDAILNPTIPNATSIPYVRFAPNAVEVSRAEIERALRAKPQGLDYDMLLMFAIGTAEMQTQGFTFLPARIPVH